MPRCMVGLYFYVTFFSVFTARCYAVMQSAVMPVVCLSLRLSVTLRYVFFHAGWNTSKIISRSNSLRPMRLSTPTWAIWCNGNTPKISVGWGHEHKTPAISPKRCKIGPRLLWRTNKKSNYALSIGTKVHWMTLSGRNVTLAEIKGIRATSYKF